ncbi:MAG: GNAT family N-acetyltransferase [Rickettsiales bacterium]
MISESFCFARSVLVYILAYLYEVKGMGVVVKKISNISQLNQCLEIRRVVFIEGQKVPVDIEIDGRDGESEHFLLLIDESPSGTARVRYYDEVAKIERVAILEKHQGKGLGKKLMQGIIDCLKEEKAVRKLFLGSQSHAIKFYENLGFTVCGEEYIEAGIPHKNMELAID